MDKVYAKWDTLLFTLAKINKGVHAVLKKKGEVLKVQAFAMHPFDKVYACKIDSTFLIP